MSNEELNLGDIPGLGPVRRAALAEAGIHDLQGLLRLKVAELAAIRGVGHWQARKIAEFLRQRGLVLEMEIPGGEPAMVVVAPSTPDERAVVAEAMDTLATQAAIEAQLEAEVAQLEQAVIAEQDSETGTALADEESAVVDASTAAPADYEQAVREVIARAAEGEASTISLAPDSQNGATAAPGGEPPVDGEAEAVVEETEEAAGAAEEPVAAADGDAPDEAAEDWQARIREQREQLPEAALELMEAIRAAAVDKQLTRQITRLLITAGEFVNDARPRSDKQRQAASEALDQAEEALRRAIEKQAFSPRQQKELADRIRRRRKQLEQVLERE